MTSDISSNDIFIEARNSSLSNTEFNLFALDGKMLNLRFRKKELNQKINVKGLLFDIADDHSALRKELKDINKQIRKCLMTQPDFTELKLNLLVNDYKEWLKEYLCLEFYDLDTGITHFHKASKRGNSIYRQLVKQILTEHTEFMNEKEFEKSFMLRNKKGFRSKETNVLFATLTWNTNIFLGNRKRAWLSSSYFYNKFTARFRKKYGKTWILKGIESTKNGYPHYHLLIISKTPFDVFKQDKKYRIKEKPNIAKLWNSFVDVEVPDNVQAVKSYIVKDIIKQYDRSENRKTKQDYLSLALCWIFRKQSYAISGFDDDLIRVSVIQTQIKNIFDLNPDKNLIFKGLVRIGFSFPYLKKHKPPDVFSVKLTPEKEKEFTEFRICKPRKKTETREEAGKRIRNEIILRNRPTDVIVTFATGTEAIIGRDEIKNNHYIPKDKKYLDILKNV